MSKYMNMQLKLWVHDHKRCEVYCVLAKQTMKLNRKNMQIHESPWFTVITHKLLILNLNFIHQNTKKNILLSKMKLNCNLKINNLKI